MTPGLIIGGGIAGLTAALALRQRGIAAVACEAAPRILPLGAGIWLAPNALQVYERLGLADKINAAGMPLDTIALVDGQQRPLLNADQARVRARYGHGTTAIRRAALQAILLAEFGAENVRLGHVCAGFEEGTTDVTVRFTNGEQLRASFVVGADGLHSRVRGALFPGARPVRGDGYRVWRGVAPLPLAAPFRRAIREAWTGGLRFGFSEIEPGVVDWFAAVPTSFDPARAGLRARLRAAFAGFAAPVPAILAATDEAGIIHTEVARLPALPRWHRGRVGLIGDAAHAGPPYLGQGGCQAVEDAYALALCLAQTPQDPARAFAALEKLRRGRARHVVRTARLMGAVGYLAGPLGALRNAAFWAMPEWVSERQFAGVYGLKY